MYTKRKVQHVYSEMYYTFRSNTRTNKKIQIDLSTVHWASGLTKTKTKKNHCVSNLILAGKVYFIPCLEILATASFTSRKKIEDEPNFSRLTKTKEYKLTFLVYIKAMKMEERGWNGIWLILSRASRSQSESQTTLRYFYCLDLSFCPLWLWPSPLYFYGHIRSTSGLHVACARALASRPHLLRLRVRARMWHFSSFCFFRHLFSMLITQNYTY